LAAGDFGDLKQKVYGSLPLSLRQFRTVRIVPGRRPMVTTTTMTAFGAALAKIHG
jgi:hypothetical protein